jgi:hypothetical protein
MRKLPEKRKPVADQATGFQKIEKLPGNFDFGEDTAQERILQLNSLRKRFALSLPLARAIADLLFVRRAA